MEYIGNIIRPPSEAESLLLQVTLGCSHSRCTFCGTYNDKKFVIKPIETIKSDIAEAGETGKKYFSRYGRYAFNKAFLMDGDALIIPQGKLLEIFRLINEHIPWIKRGGIYANTKGILRKSDEELKELKNLGLGIIYMGVESGDGLTLKKINKGSSPENMVEAGRRVKNAGIKLSVTILLGIGGVERSTEHAVETAKVLANMDPDYVGALTVMIIPGTKLWEEHKTGNFKLPDRFGFLNELKLIIENCELSDALFMANHASNYLPVKVKFPEGKEKAVKLLNSVISTKDETVLKPEFLRGL